MSKAILFPGQGSQVIGMGRDLAQAFATARLVFEEVDEALQQKLSSLMFSGEQEQLNLTENAQPAIMAVSIAATRCLIEASGKPLHALGQFVAGHSLGEYSALCAAGSLSLAQTARLLKLRGQAMQAAVPAGQGAMAALLGVELADAEAIVQEAASIGVVACANDNAPGQVVISGTVAAVEQALSLAAARGFKRSVRLPVSAPFHCALMQPAAEAMAQALSAEALHSPIVPLVANVTASAVTDPAEIKKLLVQQVTGRVRWRESVQYLRTQGVTQAIELGAGSVLAGLVKRIDKELVCTSVGDSASLETLIKTL